MAQSPTKEQVLEQVKAAFGFVPNLMAGMAEQNPAVTAAYLAAGGALDGGVLSAAERQVVMLAVSAFNDCHYCTAAHRTMAGGMNYINHIQKTAIDEPLMPQATRKAGQRKAG